MAERYLVTGAYGCIGAWVCKHLIDAGADVVASDLGGEAVRPGLLMSGDQMAKVTWSTLDVTDTQAVATLVEGERIMRIIHLAGLQIPFCRANPPLGAAVNVLGTVNIFEAAKAAGIGSIAYASSLAALGPAEDYDELPIRDDVRATPRTIYGVYKVANEGTARVYALESGVGSIGLRPHTVFGIGRDQGVTADCAKAILAAAIGKPFHIRFGGEIALQYASDVAKAFIACADHGTSEAHVCNQRYDVIRVGAFVEALKKAVPEAQITWDEATPLPFAADLDDSGLRALLGDIPHTPLETSIAQEVAAYRTLVEAGKMDLTQLDR